VRDHRYVDELSIEELEEVLQTRKRQERLARLKNKPDASDPLRSQPTQSSKANQPFTSYPSISQNATSLPRFSVEVDQPPARIRRPIKWRWIWNQLLLFIEILALVGFIVIIVQLTTTVRTINEESKILQAQPTSMPTPIIGVYVLPGGHTPPDALKQSQPAPVPVHLRDQIAAITPLPVPTPGPEQAQRIVIPAINVDAPVVEGDDWESLKYGSGHHIGSADPGERGNCVISGHNDIYGEIFRDLPDLKVGDEIVIYTTTQKYRYLVEQTRIVAPTEVSVLQATSSPVITLISCYPYAIDSHRIVVIGSLQSY
jgi:sortase A